MHERTLEQDSLDEFERKTLATIAELLHLNAVSHGFWDCEACDGHGKIAIDDNHTMWKLPFPSAMAVITCPICLGKGRHRNFGESVALITSEYSEALEAARNPADDAKCDKCDDHNRRGGLECPKCGGTGENICGSRILEELIDGIIRGMETAHKVAADLGLDIGEAFNAKHRYNLTRPHKHGKQF